MPESGGDGGGIAYRRRTPGDQRARRRFRGGHRGPTLRGRGNRTTGAGVGLTGQQGEGDDALLI